MDDTEPPRVLSAAEAARLAGVPERTIRRWVISGVLRADRSGPTLRIDLTALTPWLTRVARRPDPARRSAHPKSSSVEPAPRPSTPVPTLRSPDPGLVAKPSTPATAPARSRHTPVTPAPATPAPAPNPERLDPAAVRALMSELRATLRDRTEAAEFWKARAELLAAQLNETTQQLRLLEAQTMGAASATVAPVTAPPPPPRPWWAFLRRLGRSARARRRGRRTQSASR